MEELVAAELSPLVGRDAEIVELRRRLAGPGLVTVTGPGGVGKTRLALAAVAGATPAATTVELATVEPATVELATVTDADVLAVAILARVGRQRESGVDPLATLAASLEDGGRVLLLDNCEHLLEAVRELCGRLLRSAPALRILATSRTRLELPGEETFELAPLSLGSDGDAARLFLERAGRASRAFSADAESLVQIARLCEELDGLPLAIELAAARTRMLDLTRIANDLERRLDLTGGGAADIPRHRSLRASVEWSCDLLGEAERTLFDRLSVFAAGWELEAAEAICSGSPVSRQEVLDLLGVLVDRSLVLVDRSAGPARFGMLTTVRAYAAESLAAGGEAEAIGAAHAAWCANLVEAAARRLMGSEQAAALSLLDRELANVRAALAWSVRVDPITGMRIASAAALYWHARGQAAEGRRWLEALMPAARDAPGELRAATWWALGLMLVALGELSDAKPVVEEALGRARDAGDAGLSARAMNLRAELDLMSDPVAAAGPLDEAVTLARRARDPWCLADALAKLGAAGLYRGDPSAARGPFEECLALARRAGDERAIHRALGGLARVTAIEGDGERALALLAEGMELSGRLGDRTWVALDLVMLGELQRFVGLADEGRASAERGLALAEEIDAGYARYLGTGILGRIALARGDPDAAEERFTEALALAERAEWRPFASWWHLGLADVALARGDVDAATVHARGALAVAQAMGNRRDEARARTALGLAYATRSEHELAISELVSALLIQRDIGDAVGAPRALAALIDTFDASGQEERAGRVRAALERGPGGLDEAIRVAVRGRGSRSAESGSGWGGLTRAEAEVAELAAAGASNPEIGERLFMSRSTVKSHLSRVYAKLGVANRTELASAFAALRQQN